LAVPEALRALYRRRLADAVRFITSPAGPPVVVGTVAASVFSWLVLSNPPASSPDTWAYSTWGQAIARGERPVYEMSATTPKPLATILGTIAAPLPAPRGMALMVAIALGALVGGIFFFASKEAGAVAAVAAVVAFLIVGSLDDSLWHSHIDIVAAALVALGLAFRRVGRVACWVLAGLLRPEAWGLAALGGFMAVDGKVPQKILFAMGAGILPVLLWLGFDFASAGDPLATLHWKGDRQAVVSTVGLENSGLRWSILPVRMYRQFIGHRWSVAEVKLIGLLGLFVAVAWAMRKRSFEKALPMVVAVVWMGLLAVEKQAGQLRLLPRYGLPFVAMLGLGCGYLAGALVGPFRDRLPSLAASTLTVVAVVVFAANLGIRPRKSGAEAIAQVYRALPTVERALQCGRLGVAGDYRAPNTVVRLAGATRLPVSRFDIVASSGTYQELAVRADLAGVLDLLAFNQNESDLRSWPGVKTSLGYLAVAPRCSTRVLGVQPPLR
jgi:hypothetical protein